MSSAIFLKKCSDCEIEKESTSFFKNKLRKDGLQHICKDCGRLRRKPYVSQKREYTEKDKVNAKIRYSKNKEYFAKKRLEFKENNPEYFREHYQKNKEQYCENKKLYRELNKEKIKEYNKNYKLENIQHYRDKQKYRCKNEPMFKLKRLLRSRLNQALKSKKWIKTNTFKDYIGCNQKELIIHLESQFESWMTWENHGPYNENKQTWHIDHIIPLSKAQTSEEIYALCHYTNLRPLLAKKNLQKGAKDV